MNKLKIFLATPISGFQSEDQYILYRESVLLLIAELSNNYEVYCELQKILDIESYDTPQDSLKKDFDAIEEADLFILLHPMRIQSCSLIELGYACALRKKLLIVGTQNDLPYFVNGLIEPDYNSIIIHSSEINDKTITEIIDALSTLSSKSRN